MKMSETHWMMNAKKQPRDPMILATTINLLFYHNQRLIYVIKTSQDLHRDIVEFFAYFSSK